MPTPPARVPTRSWCSPSGRSSAATDLDRVAEALSAPRIVDTRNVVDRLALQRRGFAYRGIGRS